MIDRVALFAHLVDLVAGAVFGRIGHRVAAIAIGHRLQDVGALAGAHVFDGLGTASRTASTSIPSHFAARECRRHRRVCASLVCAVDRAVRGAHGVLVVLDDVETGNFQSAAMLKRFVDLPLVGRAVAEIGQRDLVVVEVRLAKAIPVPSDVEAPTMPWPP